MMMGISGTTKAAGMTGTTGVVVVGVWDRGVEELLGEGGDEPGELGVDRNKTLTGVGTLLLFSNDLRN